MPLTMREQVPQGNPELLVFKEVYSGHRFGLGLRNLGIGVILLGLTWFGLRYSTDVTAKEALNILYSIVVGIVGICAGLRLVTTTSEVVFDLGTDRVTETHRLLGVRSVKARRISDITCMRIRAEHRGKSKNDPAGAVYRIEVVTREGGEPIKVLEREDYAESRRTGERIAEFLERDLLDQATDAEDRRSPGELNLRVADRAGGRACQGFPSRPEGSRIACERSGDALLLRLPVRPKWLLVAAFFSAAVVCAGLTVVLPLGLLKDQEVKETLDYVMLLAPIVLGGSGTVILMVLLKRRNQGYWRVSLSPRHLRAGMRGGWTEKEKSASLHTDEIERLAAVRSAYSKPGTDQPPEAIGKRHILGVSDKRTIRFGTGLSEAELVWVEKVLTQTLSDIRAMKETQRASRGPHLLNPTSSEHNK